ncbi:MAG: dihydrofolate reductase [Pseudomonadota bacterium]
MNPAIKLCLIVARSRNGVIGRDGDLPWRLSDDLAHFKRTTKGCPIIMGRKTWQSLPRRPLPGRDNIVLSRDGTYRADGARVYTEVKTAIAAGKALTQAAQKSECFIVGGEAIYAATLPYADRLYLTDVEIDLEGDALFPAFDEAMFQETSRVPFAQDAKNEHAFRVRVLDRLA